LGKNLSAARLRSSRSAQRGMNAAVSCRSEPCYPSSRQHGKHRAVKRHEFITLLGDAPAAWPLAARPQQPGMPVIGLRSAASRGPLRQQIAAFHEGLKESGYVEGENVAVESRWAEGRSDRLPALAADLVRRQVSVIVSGGGAPAVFAVKEATT